MTVVWRPLTEADATAWVRLGRAVETADRTGENEDEADYAEMAADTEMDLASGSVGVFDGDRLIACGVAWTQPDATVLHRVRLDGCVHPDARRGGLGTRLLAELERVGRVRHELTRPDLPLELAVTGYEANLGKLALLTGAGYAPVRWFFDMRCNLNSAPPRAPLPAGVRLSGQPADSEPVRLALNEFFAEHWGNVDFSPRGWRESFTDSRAYRPDLSFLLLDDVGEIAALVLSRFYRADYDQTGVRELWIGDVGTRKSLRGKGLSTALLCHTLAAGRAAGFQQAGLSVDADNPSGALGVYRRCGFDVVSRWTFFGKRL